MTILRMPQAAPCGGSNDTFSTIGATRRTQHSEGTTGNRPETRRKCLAGMSVPAGEGTVGTQETAVLPHSPANPRIVASISSWMRPLVASTLPPREV